MTHYISRPAHLRLAAPFKQKKGGQVYWPPRIVHRVKRLSLRDQLQFVATSVIFSGHTTSIATHLRSEMIEALVVTDAEAALLSAQTVPGGGGTHALTIGGHCVGVAGHCVCTTGHLVATAGQTVSTATHVEICDWQTVTVMGQKVVALGHWVLVGGQVVTAAGHCVLVGGHLVTNVGHWLATGGHCVCAGGQRV